MRANSRRLLLRDDNLQTQSPPPSNRTQADAAEDVADVPPARFDSSSMAVTALVLLSALFFLGFFSVYARRFFVADQDDERPHRRPRRPPLPPYGGRLGLSSSSSAPGLDPLVLRALPLLPYSGAGKEQAGCAVCLSEFEEEEAVKAIPACGHVFHPDCIDAWLLCHGSCPLCRSTQLFALSSCRKLRVDVRGWAAEEQRAGEDGAGLELARVREVDVEAVVAVERDGSEERGGQGQVRKDLRTMGRSDSWCCRTQQGAANLRRSRSL